MSLVARNLVKLYFEEVWNNSSAEVAERIIAPDFANRYVASFGLGAKGLIALVQERHLAFPDLNFEVIDAVADKQKVWVRYRFTGTHLGEFWGIAPTSRQVDYQGVLMFTYANGRLTSGASVRDELTLLEQIGYVSVSRDSRQ